MWFPQTYPSDPFFGMAWTTTHPPSLRPKGSLSITGFSYNKKHNCFFRYQDLCCNKLFLCPHVKYWWAICESKTFVHFRMAICCDTPMYHIYFFLPMMTLAWRLLKYDIGLMESFDLVYHSFQCVLLPIFFLVWLGRWKPRLWPSLLLCPPHCLWHQISCTCYHSHKPTVIMNYVSQHI